jgi:hypothetical protein
VKSSREPEEGGGGDQDRDRAAPVERPAASAGGMTQSVVETEIGQVQSGDVLELLHPGLVRFSISSTSRSIAVFFIETSS